MNFILSISVGVVKLTGGPGTGKTALLKQLNDELREEKQELVFFANPPASISDLRYAITRQLRLESDLDFERSLTRYILSKSYDQQRLILVFDDADKLHRDTLLALVLLRNIRHNDNPLVSMVLCGGEELNAQLAEPALRPLVDDLLLGYELNPMTREQLLAFGRAVLAHGRQEAFAITPDLLAELLKESGGLPGPVPAVLESLRERVLREAVAGPQPVAALAPTDPADDALLVSASRAEKLNGENRRQQVLQYTAIAATVIGAAYLAWPRLAPLVTPLLPLASDEAPAEPAAPSVAIAPETPPAAEPQAPVVVAAPAAEVAAEAIEEPAAPLPEPPEAEPAAAEVAVAPPAPAPAPAEPAPAPEPALVLAPEPPVPAPAVSAPEPAAPVAAPAPAAALAATVTPAPPPTGPAASPAALEAVIRQWLSAWQSQNVDAFFSYYHTDFAPLYQDTRADWRSDRSLKITRPASIAISFDDFALGAASPIGTTVRFWMNYRSPTYADRTLKEVVLGPDLDGQWRILQEFNRDVAALPPDASFSTLALAPAPAAPPATPATPPAQAPAALPPAPAAPPQVAGVPAPAPTPPPPAPARTAMAPATFDRVRVISAAPAPQPPAPIAQDSNGIGRFLESWIAAWQSQDVNGYLRHYHPDYKAPTMRSADEWRNDRALKISRPTSIELRLEDLDILEADAATARVQFTLEYHSTHYADRTLKEIQLEKTGDDWIIVVEKNVQVENLPLIRLAARGNLATR